MRYARRPTIPRVMLVAMVAAAGGCAPFVSPPGPAIPDRPGYSDGPSALPPNAIELEGGFTDDRAGSAEYTTVGEALLRIGVGAHTELRLYGNSYATSSSRGLPDVHGREDPKVGFKTSFRSKPDSVHSIAPNLAVLAAMTLPAGASAFRNAHAQPEAKLAASWTTPTPFSVYGNLGAGGVYDGAGWGERGWLSLALSYSASPRVSVYGEGFSMRSLHGGALPANDVDGGITYLVNDRFQLDLHAGHGFGHASGSERFVGAGFARRW